MRVLHIDAGNLFGGVETFLLTLARCRDLCPEMHPEFAVCFEGRLAEELCRTGVRVHRLGAVRARNPLQVIRARRRLARILASGEIDVVVCHMPWVHAIFGPVAQKANLPSVLWIHSAANREHWVERWARMTTPSLIICNSEYSAKSVDHAYASPRVSVIYCPVAGCAGEQKASCRAKVRSDLGASDADVVIMQASRLEKWKGHTVLLESLFRLRDLSNWTCWLAGGPQNRGESQYLQNLKRLVEVSGLESRVRFLGDRSDVRHLLSAADILCQPNTEPEPFGLIFVEAMLAGLPVVTFAFGGALEILDRDSGFLVEPGNVEEFTNTLRHLVVQPKMRSRMGATSRARAAALFSPQKQMSKMFTEFEELTLRQPRVRSSNADRAKTP
jgi:glycosyltransferase involved in cell wall biosynthesis